MLKNKEMLSKNMLSLSDIELSELPCLLYNLHFGMATILTLTHNYSEKIYHHLFEVDVTTALQ